MAPALIPAPEKMGFSSVESWNGNSKEKLDLCDPKFKERSTV